jgi:hypothetical protein
VTFIRCLLSRRPVSVIGDVGELLVLQRPAEAVDRRYRWAESAAYRRWIAAVMSEM